MLKQIDYSENKVHMRGEFDPHYIVNVLAEIWGREHGCELKITLTPKEIPQNHGLPMDKKTDKGE